MVRLLLIALLWLAPLWAQAATIVAQLDRNPVTLGDSVVIRFIATDMTSDEPDFSPLQKDFEIRGRSQSTSFSFNNNRSTSNTTWELTLLPLKTGVIQIPPIHFGADQSQALDLQVVDQPTSAAGNAPDIFIELEAESKQPYVQQQTVVTIRILSAVQWDRGHVIPPNVDLGKGEIKRIGNEANSTKLVNGRNYNLKEIRYALIPQQSGELRLGRAVFEGILAEPGPSTYDPFGLSGKRIRRFSQPLALQVQGQPTAYTGKQWLPARSITLNAHWQTPPDKLKAGEPVTLTLAIVADGLAAEQLPKLEVQAPAGIKAYTDQPELRNDAGNSGVIGVRQEKWVVVAPYNGEYEFPGLSVDWWNTATGKQETAKVDGVKLVVTGGQAAPAGASPPTPATQPQAGTQPDDTVATPGQSGGLTSLSWGWYAMALLLIWLGLTAVWLLWRWWQKFGGIFKKSAQPAATMTFGNSAKADAKAVLRKLEQACQQNKPQAAHDALVQWIDVGLGIRPALISSLREQATQTLRTEIDALNAVLYGRSSDGWKGAGLWAAIRGFKPAAQGQRKDSGLAELYPD